MKKAFIPIVIFLIATCSLTAQINYQVQSAMDFYRLSKISSGDFFNSVQLEDVEGSPYLNDEFIIGTVYTTSELKYVDVPLRYNIFNDNIEFRNNDKQVLALTTPEIVDRVTFGNYEMAYIPFASQKQIRRGFLKVVINEKISLYTRIQVNYKEPEEPAAYKDAEPAKFTRKADTFYLRHGKNEAVKVKNKGEVIDFFPAHNDEIASYIKKNKIKTNKEDGLKKLVEYYNSNF